MIQIDKQKLRQLFKNRSNCYADADDVIQAMDENCFIETVTEALSLFAVSNNEVSVCNCGLKQGKMVFNEVTQELYCDCGKRIKVTN